ncbi:MAG: GAF domain-containing protein [Spirochaetaceae bacterium]|nr:MAG: GAF domain-containing protein [Spirochaetaceae bacterium]
MTTLFWIDIIALCSSAVVAIALILTVLGTGVRRALNQSFSLFAAMEAFWAISSLLLRLSLWLGIGSHLLLAELATLGINLMTITLLAFAARYVGRPSRAPDIACLIGLGITTAFSVFLFRHRIVFNPYLLANGSSSLQLSRLGLMIAPLPILFLVWSLVLFWSNRRRIGERFFALSVFIILLGLLTGGILNLPFPILSITNTIGVSLIGFGVITRQLLNPLREREARLRVVNSIAAAVSRTLEIDVLMETVYQEVTPLFRSDAFFVALYDEDTNELEFRLQVDEGEREPPDRQRLGTGLTSWVIQSRKPLLISDFDHIPENVPKPELYGTMKMPAAWLGVPMLVGDRAIGVICIQTYQPRSYGEEEQLLLATIAEQVAMAVQNARLYETVAQELSERRHTERSLRESEEKFRNLAEQSPNMIFINRQGRVVYANRKCEEVMGYTREEYYHRDFDFLSLIDPDDIKRVQAAFSRHLAGQEVPPYEYRLLTKTNQRLDVIITTKLINYGNQPALLGIITDISARKRTERLLQALNSASAAMEQAQSPEAIFTTAGDRFKQFGFNSVVFLLNEEDQSLKLQYTSYDPPILEKLRSVMGIAWENFSLPVPEGGVLETIVKSRQTVYSTARESFHRSFPKLQPESVDKLIDLLGISKAISAPMVPEDRVVGMLSVQSEDLGPDDIPAVTAFANQMATAWRKTRLLEDLKDSLDELQVAQEQLLQAQKMEAVGKLAGGIAHDFNNLLTAIKGFTELLLRRSTSEDPSYNDLMGIKKASEQAARLTRQLLAFSRKQVLQPRIINLNEIIGRMQEMLQRLIGEHIELVVELQEDLHTVRADPGQIEQIILNLAVNARDAMSDGGTLTLKSSNIVVGRKKSWPELTMAAGEYAVLAVRDTGSGMDEETRRRLFEPFFTTKETGKGTGLGLATVYGIVRQSNGMILVDSSPGEGTTFTIYLPREEGPRESLTPVRKPGEKLHGSETILLVEDEDMVRQLAEQVLREYGYTVLVSSRGTQALEIAAEHSDSIQLMITDMIMPGGMNGKQLADRLVKTRPKLKVLYISGYADGSLFSKAERNEQIHLLEKPFSPLVLIQKVRELLEEE